MSGWKFERIGSHPDYPDQVQVVAQGDEARCRWLFENLCARWDAGWRRSHGLARVVNPAGEVVLKRHAPVLGTLGDDPRPLG